MDDFRIRRARPGDQALVLGLLSELMPDVDPVRRYRWLYEDGPEGRAVTLLALDRAGETMGMTSLFPRRVQVDGKTVRAALGGDGWVRPAFRRQGVGTTLHLASRMALAAEGMELMLGTPSPANRTPLAAVGAFDVGEVFRFTRPCLFNRFGARGGPGIRLEPAKIVDPRVDGLWEEVAAEGAVGTVRDARFYLSRFQAAPGGFQQVFLVFQSGRLLGAAALETSPGRLRLLDLLVPAARFPALLTALTRCARSEEAVELCMTREEAGRKALWRFGFVAREWRPLNLLLSEGAAHGSALSDPSRWSVSWADSDLSDTAHREREAPVYQPAAETALAQPA